LRPRPCPPRHGARLQPVLYQGGRLVFAAKTGVLHVLDGFMAAASPHPPTPTPKGKACPRPSSCLNGDGGGSRREVSYFSTTGQFYFFVILQNLRRGTGVLGRAPSCFLRPHIWQHKSSTSSKCLSNTDSFVFLSSFLAAHGVALEVSEMLGFHLGRECLEHCASRGGGGGLRMAQHVRRSGQWEERGPSIPPWNPDTPSPPRGS